MALNFDASLPGMELDLEWRSTKMTPEERAETIVRYWLVNSPEREAVKADIKRHIEAAVFQASVVGVIIRG